MENFNLDLLAYYIGISVLYIKVIGCFILSFLLTYFTIPKIIRISLRKHLMDVPGLRSSHIKQVPTLGGVAIYFAISISVSLFASDILGRYIFFAPALVLLFFIGLMDDLLVVAPKKKLYTQIVAALMIIMGSDIRIQSFFGFMGIYELSYFTSVIFTTLVFIMIINSYNLIDGIDGLAGGVGIVILTAFVFIFFRFYDYSMGILAVSLMASLLAFLKYNLSSKYKIFMGDTGSLIVGYIISFMAIRFINLSSVEWINMKSSPIVAIAILIVPLMDTVSVVVIRLMKRKPIFLADKNHIHHRLLKLGLNHLQTSIVIVVANILIILFAYLIRNININLMFMSVFIVSLLLSLLPLALVEKITTKKRKKSLKVDS